MIPDSSILTSLMEHRCALSQQQLLPGEVLVSRTAVPALYNSSQDASSDKVLQGLIVATIELMFRGSVSDESSKEALRKFWIKVLERKSSDTASRENLLHAYLYFFWEKAWSQSSDVPLVLDEAYIPQRQITWEATESNFSRRLLPRVRRDAPVDILARDGTNVLLIEIKYGFIDDRAIGQIYRYFEDVRFLCHTMDHLCDLRTVTPVLIAEGCEPRHWASLPSIARELFRILFYYIDGDELILRDGRRGLQSQLRGHARYRF